MDVHISVCPHLPCVFLYLYVRVRDIISYTTWTIDINLVKVTEHIFEPRGRCLIESTAPVPYSRAATPSFHDDIDG